MIAELGYAAIFLAFCSAVYTAIASLYGAKTEQMKWTVSARNATIATFVLTTLAVIAMLYLMLTGDFSVSYVTAVTSRSMPTYLKVTALWGGQAGSLLFWNVLLTGFSALAMSRKWRGEKALMPYTLFVASITTVFFLFLTTFIENPFARLASVPADGEGLNPLLRHPGMIIHPPMLYLGFTGLSIPYAFAMGALLSGKLDDVWIRTTRRWTLFGWLFLSLGLILGGRWAYDVLGWGGYWAWDPVENASFMPWLAGTAFLHSVMIQEKRGIFKMWNMILIALTYGLMVLGTFIVRTGVINSVHSFAESDIGVYFFGFVSFVLIFSTTLIVWRANALKSDNHVTSMLSREVAFLANNFVVLAILFVVAWGTLYPIISELFLGQKTTVAQPFYTRTTGPLFAVLMLLMGVAPLTMWYKSSAKKIVGQMRVSAVIATLSLIPYYLLLGVHNIAALIGLWILTLSLLLTLQEIWRGVAARHRKGESYHTALSNLFARNRRRYGGYMIHLGVIIMGFGIIATQFYQQETQIRLLAGESTSLGEYTATFTGASRYAKDDDVNVTEATLNVYHRGNLVKQLTPRTEAYNSGTPRMMTMSIPSARSTISEDFYVLVVNWESVTDAAATFKIYLNPLINWVWGGGVLFVIGTMIAAWPDPVDEVVRAAVRKRERLVAMGD